MLSKQHPTTTRRPRRGCQPVHPASLQISTRFQNDLILTLALAPIPPPPAMRWHCVCSPSRALSTLAISLVLATTTAASALSSQTPTPTPPPASTPASTHVRRQNTIVRPSEDDKQYTPTVTTTYAVLAQTNHDSPTAVAGADQAWSTVPVAAVMGLIMPNPEYDIYTGGCN